MLQPQKTARGLNIGYRIWRDYTDWAAKNKGTDQLGCTNPKDRLSNFFFVVVVNKHTLTYQNQRCIETILPLNGCNIDVHILEN